MSRQLCRFLGPASRFVGRRSFFGPPAPFQRSIFDDFQRRCNELERDFFRAPFGYWRPFAPLQTTLPESISAFRDPIVEEGGVKKFKLEFDVRRFKPENVRVTTSKEERTLTVEAKFEDEQTRFEYSRRVAVPEGVQPDEINAKFTGDGVLVFEAPYAEPPQPDPPKERDVQIERK